MRTTDDPKWIALLQLLREYGEEEMDQFDTFKIATNNGFIYVHIGLEPLAENSFYRRLDPTTGKEMG